MSYKFRDTAAAILFLAVLAVGVVYLALGFYWQDRLADGAGFLSAEKPYEPGRLSWPVRVDIPRRLPAPGEAADPEALTAALMALDDQVETELTDMLDRDKVFIETYGLVQKTLGRRVMDDVQPHYTVTRLSDGSLSFLDPDSSYIDTSGYAQSTARFRDALEAEYGIPFLFVQVPQKASVYGEGTLAHGLYDYGDSHADTFLRTLQREDVDYLDLRPILAGTGRYSELFFRTDHHWTPEAAFLAWQAVAERLETDYGFDFDEAATDPAAWDREVLEDVFLGSQGKRVGSLYAGMDDFELWTPKGETAFEYEVPIMAYDRVGTMEESLLFPERLKETDPYQANPYTYYSGGDYTFARMKNLKHPDGPTIVLLRDSFACPFAPFMAMGCGELVTIDLRYFRDDLMTYIEWVEPDMVIALYSPGSLVLPAAFDFFHVPDQTSWPADRRPLTDELGLDKPALAILARRLPVEKAQASPAPAGPRPDPDKR